MTTYVAHINAPTLWHGDGLLTCYLSWDQMGPEISTSHLSRKDHKVILPNEWYHLHFSRDTWRGCVTKSVCWCVHMSADACGGHKRVSDVLELEL